MEEKMTSNSQVSPEEGRQVNNGVEHVSEKALIKIAGDLSLENKEFCEKETQQIMDLLSPKQFACLTLMGLYLIDLYGAEEADEIIVARLVMNRKPKNKSVNALTGTIRDVGMLIMLLVIPGTVAKYFGYEIEDFEGKPIPEDKLRITIVIIDGQTRYLAIRKLRKEHPELVLSNVYAYFPLHWTSLTKMLQAINLKVFTWTNSDFISGLRGTGLKPEVEKALAYIQSLEQRGYIAMDDNGTSLTLLDPDLDRKLVVIGDLNLYFALQQDPSCFEDVWVEVVSELPKGRKWYY